MEKKDLAREIFEKYYGQKDKLVRIILNDDTVMEGMLIGFFRKGDEAEGSHIWKWHFIDKSDISEYKKVVGTEASDEFGSEILQEDIKEVRFK